MDRVQGEPGDRLIELYDIPLTSMPLGRCLRLHTEHLELLCHLPCLGRISHQSVPFAGRESNFSN